MRLQKVWISEYKNLKNFTLTFDGNSFIDVFVGKNGTGKSNLFEALIEIFRHLYENNYEIPFNYIIHFELDGSDKKIEWDGARFKLGERQQKTIRRTKLPENILIYYSGHNTKVTELVQAYEESFKKAIKGAEIGETRKFIGIGKEYKQLLLSVMLLQKEDNKARQFICAKLGIKEIASELKLVLKRPFYAKQKSFDIVNNDETDKYWKPEGITKEFLDLITKCESDNTKGPVRSEGYLAKDELYILYLDIYKIRLEFLEKAQELFRQFDNLKIIEMLEEISIQITLEDGTKTTTHSFSDGQFQSVYIYSIIELFKDRNCVTLLDEPDCFLHPEWQFDFLKQVFVITDTTAKYNHVLMSTHSATTLVSSDDHTIKLFKFDDRNKIVHHSVSKKYAIQQLSAGLILLNEEKQTLSIIHKIRLERKPVLFTEGSSDPLVIETAWHKLRTTVMPFISIYAFNDSYLGRLIQDEKVHNENGVSHCSDYLILMRHIMFGTV